MAAKSLAQILDLDIAFARQRNAYITLHENVADFLAFEDS